MSAFPRRFLFRRPAPVLDVAQEFARRGVVLLDGDVNQLAIGPSGVTVIHAGRYAGDISVERRGAAEHLIIAGLDRTDVVDGVLAQAEVVRASLTGDVPVRALLCFVDGDWPWSGPPEVRGVPVVTPRRAAKLCATGHVPAAAVAEIADALHARLAPA